MRLVSLPPPRMRKLAATVIPVVLATVAAAFGAGSSAADPQVGAAQRDQTTVLISRAAGGGIPNGPSTNAVISNDKRFARVIAFQSDASNLVAGDRNSQRDVFAVFRAGSVNNKGTPWQAGRTRLISRTSSGGPSNGPSFAPSVGGGFHSRPRCIAFLSSASNLVGGDTNGKTDAFVSRGPGGKPKRLPLPGNRQPKADATGVAVSGDCSRVAFASGGRMYVRVKNRTRRLRPAGAADPSFSTGKRNDLVFGARRGVYLAKNGTGRPRLVARGGRNPAYNDIKRRVVTYETSRGGRTQIGYKDIGRGEHIISSNRGRVGDAASSKPVIGNAGYYVAFESAASNLGVSASGATGDDNGAPDVYLYSNVRDLTLVQSVEQKAVPLAGGGANPSMSFYANYIVFDSPAPLDSSNGAHQVFMRYLGGL
jgi:hypothetical protein